MQVELHGNTGQRTISLKEQIEGIHARLAKARETDKDRSARDRNWAFAIVGDLRGKLKRFDATEKDLWDAIMKRFGVESRSEFTPLQWATVAAELDCARNNAHALRRLVQPDYIADSAENYRAYSTEILTGQTRKIHEAPPTADVEALEKRCQKFADNNKKTVRMVRQDEGYCRIFVPTDSDIPY